MTSRALHRNAEMASKETISHSTRHWSCSTLADGVDCLLDEARKVEEEEEMLNRMIQDLYAGFFFLFMQNLPSNLTLSYI